MGGRIAFGLLGDRFGAKRVLVLGLLVQAFGALGYVFVRELAAFYAVAALFGFIYAGTMPLYAVLVRENFPLRMMGTVIGGTAMAGSLGMATGPLAGGLIYDTFRQLRLALYRLLGHGARRVPDHIDVQADAGGTRCCTGAGVNLSVISGRDALHRPGETNNGRAAVSKPAANANAISIMSDPPRGPPLSLHQREQRLAFLDDVGGELAAGDTAGVPGRMDRSGWNEEHVSGLQRDRRLVLDLIFERAFEDIDNLFAGMRVLAKRHAGGEIDADLDGLASGRAEVVPLQVGSRDPVLLRLRAERRQNGSGDKHRHRHDLQLLHRAHVELPGLRSGIGGCRR